MIKITQLQTERWKEHSELRLGALESDPIAFGSSVEEEKDLSEEEWKKRMKNTIFALADDKLVGMIVFIFDPKIKTSHIANIFGFYVARDYRRQGIGKRLIKTALTYIRKNENIIKINLAVTVEQKPAIALYEKFGFEIVGRERKSLKVSDRFYDELIMEKFL
ncbi:MAG: acetyltransferase [Promethearchaeota archaeon CR_4]|nr:MAG: acetyltransferase [Candidatus Lokiarchaeota archaeon CR_4]